MSLGRISSHALAVAIAAAPSLAAASVPGSRAHGVAITYQQRVADGNSVGATITNYGVVGNNFSSRNPSLEFPLGSGYEHLAHGGLWIGAQALDDQGAFVGVTTAMVDYSQGSATQSATEFTPDGDAILVRSISPVSPYYSPSAISEQDLVSSYVDVPARSTVGNPETHRPLNIRVRQENYAWSLPGYANVLFFHYVIRNDGAPLQNLWAGLYTELASGNKNAYSTWPPSSAGGPGSWYSKKWVEYDDTLHMVREHYCASQPIPAGCNLAAVPPWIGVQLLGARAGGADVALQTTFQAWNYAPSSPDRDQDVERYALMSAGTADPNPAFPPPDDPTELLAAGPFALVAPGDSVEIDFAVVGGADPADLRTNGALAKQAYDAYYDIASTAALVSFAGARATTEQVELEWRTSSDLEAALSRRRLDDGFHPEESLARLRPDGEGRLRHVDREVTPGADYEYRLASAALGMLDAVRVHVPGRAGLALTAIDPNPTLDGRAQVWFTLPHAGTARLELFDAQGRRIGGRSASWGAGTHRIELNSIARPVKAGLYFVRLEQAGHVAWSRFVLAP